MEVGFILFRTFVFFWKVNFFKCTIFKKVCLQSLDAFTFQPIYIAFNWFSWCGNWKPKVRIKKFLKLNLYLMKMNVKFYFHQIMKGSCLLTKDNDISDSVIGVKFKFTRPLEAFIHIIWWWQFIYLVEFKM
jgi:hypothetical protein